MKYAREVIDLMGVYPGRRFKVRQIVNHAAPNATPKQRASIRVSIHRVLRQLEGSGQVESTRAAVVNGADAEYWWVELESQRGFRAGSVRYGDEKSIQGGA